MNSSRLPNKMMQDVGGIPLIVRTAKQAQQSDAIRVIVATDHSDIVNACIAHGIEAIITKHTHETGTDRIAEAVKLLNFTPDTIIINVQGDEPLISPDIINELAKFIYIKKTEVATIAHAITTETDVFNPSVVKVILDKNQNALYFSRAAIPFCRDNIIQNSMGFTIPPESPFLRHIGIYAYAVKFLNNYGNMPSTQLENLEKLEQLRALYNGHKIAVLIAADAPVCGVDTYEDLIRIRDLINK